MKEQALGLSGPGCRRSQPASASRRKRGQLGICGVGAAVANAVYNATGVRIRDYPLTLDKLLTRMA